MPDNQVLDPMELQSVVNRPAAPSDLEERISLSFPQPERSEWGMTPEERIRSRLERHADAGIDYEEARRNMRGHGVDLAPGAYQQFSEQRQRERTERQAREDPEMAAARQRYSGAEETWSHRWGRTGLGALSTMERAKEERARMIAQQNIQQGRGTREDYDAVAGHERMQQLLGQRSFGEQAFDAVLGLPAGIVEFLGPGAVLKRAAAIGGASSAIGRFMNAPGIGAAVNRNVATTAMAPSLWMNHMVDMNVRAGRDPGDITGLPVGFGLAMANMATYNAAGRLGGAIGGRLGNIGGVLGGAAAGTGTGMLGQQAVDIVDSAFKRDSINETGYGLLGDVIRGQGGEFFKHAAIQALTFSVFAGLHAVDAAPIKQKFTDATKEMARAGLTPEESARMLVASTMHSERQPWLNLPEPARRAVENYRNTIGAVMDAAEKASGKPGQTPPQEGIPIASMGTPREQANSFNEMVDKTFKGKSVPEGAVNGPMARHIDLEHHTVSMRLDPAARTVKIDYSRKGEGAYRYGNELQHGSREVWKGVKDVTRWAVENGYGVEAVPGGPEQASAYAERLTKAGLVEEPGHVWREPPPQAASEAALGEHGIDAQRAAELAEQLKANPELAREVDLPAEEREELEHLTKRAKNEPESVAERLSRLTASLQSRAGAGVSAQSEANAVPAADQGGARVPGAEAAQGERPVPGAAPANVQANASAGAAPEPAAHELSMPGPEPTPHELKAAEAGVWTPESRREPGDGNPAWEAAKKAVMDFVREEGGFLDPQKIKEYAAQKYGEMRRFFDAVGNGSAKLAGVIFRKVRLKSNEASEYMGRYIGRHDYVRDYVEGMQEKVLGHETMNNEEKRNELGSAATEWRIRHEKGRIQAAMTEALQDSQDPALSRKERNDAAKKYNELSESLANQGTLVGNQFMPDEAAYQRIQQSPEWQRLVKEWGGPEVGGTGEYSPKMDQWFRESKGLDPADPLQANSQIPGFVFHLSKAGQEAPEPGSSAGNLTSYKHGEAGFAKKATFAHEYETDIAKILENTIRGHYNFRSKAMMMRAMEEGGIAKWEKPGLEEGYREFSDAKPPKGSAAEKEGRTSWKVVKDLADDYQDALGTDRSHAIEEAKKVTGFLNWSTLQSIVEPLTHVKNQIRSMFEEGVFINFIKQAPARLAGDQSLKDRLIDLTGLGVSRPERQALSKYNPMEYVSRGIHWLRDGILLAGDKAFTDITDPANKTWKGQIASMFGIDLAKGIENTETNRRDFLNQMAGQYNTKAQPRWVKFLRELGLSPFITQGFIQEAQGAKALIGQPNIRTTSWGADAVLRSWKMTKMAAVAGFTAALSKIMWGNVFGDDKTPIGNLKVGVDSQGNTISIPMLQFTGLDRGMREFGLMALAEGVRHNEPGSAISKQALLDGFHSMMHPLEGPPVSFVSTLITGEDAMGHRLIPRHSETPVRDRVLAALGNMNPLAANAFGWNRASDAPPQEWSDKAAGFLGSVGPRFKGDYSAWERRIHELGNDRMAAQARQEVYSREAEYRRLSSISNVMIRLQKEALTASPERRREIQRLQNEVAGRVMQ
jgi:hypothetical protein